MTSGDVLLLLSLLTCLPIARLLPQRQWPRVAWALEPFFNASWSGRLARSVQGMVATKHLHDGGTTATALLSGHSHAILLRHLMILGGPRRLERWARVSLEGEAHLRDALAAGRGAVLWVQDFTYSTIVTKLALSDAGYAVAHLSRPSHGLSRSRIGMKVLNPIQVRVEDRYLEDRVMIAESGATTALRALRRRLGDNGVVSVTACGQGLQIARVPFLGGALPLALGAPFLAYATGAALLPVATVALDWGRFAVRIDAPIAVDRAAPRADACRAAAATLAARLSADVRSFPEQWLGWEDLLAGPAPSCGRAGAADEA